MTRGEQIREGRKAREWSQPQLARLIDVNLNPRTVGFWENGNLKCLDKRWYAIQAVFAENPPVFSRVVRATEQKGIYAEPSKAPPQNRAVSQSHESSVDQGRTPMQRIERIQNLLEEQKLAAEAQRLETEKTNENMNRILLMLEFLLAEKIGKMPSEILPVQMKRKPKAG